MTDSEYNRLILAHQSSLYAFIRSMVPSHVSVDDILQETNITLLHKENAYETGTNFKAFAFQVARFKILSSFRDAERDGWLLVDSELSDQLLHEMAEHPVANAWAQDALRRCLEQLPERHLELIRQRYWNGDTLRDIAARQHRTEGGLQQLFFRIRQRLKECIEFRAEHPDLP